MSVAMSKTLSDFYSLFHHMFIIYVYSFYLEVALLMFKNCQGFSAVYIIQIEFK